MPRSHLFGCFLNTQHLCSILAPYAYKSVTHPSCVQYTKITDDHMHPPEAENGKNGAESSITICVTVGPH